MNQLSRIHNLNTVYLDFKFVLKNLQSGNPPLLESERMIQQLEKALELLRTEIQDLEDSQI